MSSEKKIRWEKNGFISQRATLGRDIDGTVSLYSDGKWGISVGYSPKLQKTEEDAKALAERVMRAIARELKA